MQSAQDKLAAVLAQTAIATPRCTVVSNFAAKAVASADEIRETLTRQVTGSVRWVECMQSLIAAGHTRFIELGPDGTLAGLMGKIDKSVQIMTIKDVASLEATVAALQ
jgi:[acyl-carrier-protein] S-malonyltransferase